MLSLKGKLSSASWSKDIIMMMRWIHIAPCVQKKIPTNLKGKSKSSQEWITRQLNDPYVKKAQEMNYRARSAFKLIEIDDKAKILKPGQVIIECGAAPGAWTQVIVKRINADGKAPKKRVGTVIGIDLLPIAPLEGAIFLSGHDFTSRATSDKIKDILMKQRAKELELRNLKTDTSTGADDRNGRNMLFVEANTIENTNQCDVGMNEGIVPRKQSDRLVDVVLSDMAPNASGVRDTDHPRIIKLVETALVFAIENGKPNGHFLSKVWDGSDAKRLENLIASYYDQVSRFKPPSSRNDSSEFFILGRYKK